MNIGLSFNPFYLYSITLSIVLLLYSFGWSELYPRLTWSSLAFAVSTVVISILCGYYYDKKLKTECEDTKNPLNIVVITLLVIISYMIEFIYSGVVPFFEIFILKSDFVYLNYSGIPTFHVFLVTFNSFFAIYVFNRYLLDKKKSYLAMFLLNLLPSILIYNRGMLTMIIISCVSVFIFVKWSGTINYKRLIILSLVALIFLYIFGIFGNIRSNKDYEIGNNVANSGYIMWVGEASNSFEKSIVPKPLFWGYIYISSPLANLQKNMNVYTHHDINFENIYKFINRSIIPDFISKRIDSAFSTEYDHIALINPSLTASSLYSAAFVDLGILGIVLLYLYFIIVVMLYRLLFDKSSSFFITGISILNTITMLNFFGNMFVFSGLSFQLVYPVLFTIIYEKEYFKNLKNRVKNLINFKDKNE